MKHFQLTLTFCFFITILGFGQSQLPLSGNGLMPETPFVSTSRGDAPAFNVNITGPDSVCGGIQRYKANIQNPVGTYTYNWEANGGSLYSLANGATCDIYWNNTTSITTGSAKVTVIDNSSNQSIATLQVAIFPTVTPSLAGSATPCPGIINPYSTESGQSEYSWNISSGGIIQSGQNTNSVGVVWVSPGNQLLSVAYKMASGCVAAKEFVLPVRTQTVAKIIGMNEGPLNSKPSYSTQAGMTNYSWGISGGEFVSANGTPTITVKWTEPGEDLISIDFTDANGCPSTSTVKTVKIYGVGMEEIKTGTLRAYPNPVNDNLRLEFPAKNPGVKNLLVFDLFGRKVREFSTHESPFFVNVGDLSPGVYALKLLDGTAVYSVKIIKN